MAYLEAARALLRGNWRGGGAGKATAVTQTAQGGTVQKFPPAVSPPCYQGAFVVASVGTFGSQTQLAMDRNIIRSISEAKVWKESSRRLVGAVGVGLR